ncbi:hypothetical protein MMC13_004889 [Lambiella insularis]|nr:hypothetical protein [Lambiella insularis]
MREAEQERLQMASSIERLETEKRELELANAKTIEENRQLLDQLEDLNTNVSDSDAHIQVLTATLQATQQEMQKLAILAARTTQLESELSAMETEQCALQSKLISSEEENRSAIQRWKSAERTVAYLQDQVEGIEREAAEERERHAETVGRMERRRTVESELETAAGRLKGSTAINTLGRTHTAGSSVVSHFVKDILQDNANLQMGIVELREMLINSNAEIEGLREQMLLVHDAQPSGSNAPLSSELVDSTLPEPVPEVHVHHHYHAPEASIQRKPRKKRSITPGRILPTSGTSTPGGARVREWRSNLSSTATTKAQASVALPSAQRPIPIKHRSMQSNHSLGSFAPSSVPSSPLSQFRASSVFDNIDNSLDLSRPTSPESSIPPSPMALAAEFPGQPQPSHRSFSAPLPLQLKQCADRTHPTAVYGNRSTDHVFCSTDIGRTPLNDSTIPEEVDNNDFKGLESPCFEEDLPASVNPTSTLQPHPPLRRATSHESLLSVSGLDIHSLHNRPSQMFIGRGFTPRSLYALPSPTTPMASTNPLVSPTIATARPPVRGRTRDSSNYNRSLLSAHSRTSEGKQASFRKLVGGWTWGKKGVTTMGSTSDQRSKITMPTSPFDGRSPGVNQSGPIQGLLPSPKVPTEVQPAEVDTELLEELLHDS